mmetsp:Transcript_21041/g.28613  ORF Transcript_21041/g.28613 Transcript_21041/m.28613 type:complete len:103 (-) Transcript_21041:608-916(-)
MITLNNKQHVRCGNAICSRSTVTEQKLPKAGTWMLFPWTENYLKKGHGCHFHGLNFFVHWSLDDIFDDGIHAQIHVDHSRQNNLLDAKCDVFQGAIFRPFET